MDEFLRDEVIARLEQIAETRAEEYRTAAPFPHIVIDDFLPTRPLLDVLGQFPAPQQAQWKQYDNARERKLEFSAAEKLPPPLRDTLYFLNSSVMLQFLERLTGIDGLIPDPYFTGGGLHQIVRGGKLDVHADFNRLERLKLDRRLNLLLYVNVDWKDEYGGHLELWDRSMTRCVKRIPPVFNRCVIFSTTDDAFHGHPAPLTCPEGSSRKSVVSYYYTNGRPRHERRAGHSTLWKARPGEQFEPRFDARRIVKRVLRSMLPPIVIDAGQYVQRKLKCNTSRFSR